MGVDRILNEFQSTKSQFLATTGLNPWSLEQDEEVDDLDEYRDSVRDLYDVRATPEQIKHLSVEGVELDEFGPAVFADFNASAHTMVRDRRLIRQHPVDAIRLQVVHVGEYDMRIDGSSASLDASAVQFFDYSCPFEVDCKGADSIGFFIPHSTLGYDARRHKPLWQIRIDTPIGRMIKGGMLNLQNEIGKADKDVMIELVSGLEAMVVALLRGGLQSNNDELILAARSASMRAYLDKNLTDPDLGIASLAEVFGASRATIFRDFGEYGGVVRYIMGRRLERAYQDLASGPAERGAVTRTAYRWGFSSAAHFSNLFFGRFGCRPGEIVGLQRQSKT